MTKIKVVGSSSSGNGYIVESGNQILIIECGCPFNKYLSAMNYDKGLENLVGCIVTHKHGDHLNKSTTKSFNHCGISVYSHDDVCNFDNNVKRLKFGVKNKIGQFYVQMFKVSHNVPNVGYLVDCPTGERIVFATDTTNVPYKFKNVHCFLIECNYDTNEIVENMMNDEWNQSKSQNHMSIEDCIDFCQRNKSIFLQKIIIIHMSSSNINPVSACERIKKETNFDNVCYAEVGSVYEIDNTIF